MKPDDNIDDIIFSISPMETPFVPSMRINPATNTVMRFVGERFNGGQRVRDWAFRIHRKNVKKAKLAQWETISL